MRKITKKRSDALLDLTVEALTFGTPADDQPGGPPFDNWRWHLDDQGAAWALLDKKDAGTNTLSEDVLVEFNDLLGHLEGLRPKGLVIRSAKAWRLQSPAPRLVTSST